MKPKETNTAAITPTEAHRSLVADSEARALASLAMVAAESADRNVSLRLENDQLRAENKANQHELNEARNAKRLARMQLDLARAERDAERARLDWLLNITQPPVVHTTGWPYPDTRGTYGHRFIGRVYYESCEGRPEMTYFKDRAAIDAAMKEGAK